ncbi:hypothetical protein FOA52_009921 [Chlamydomonas sp. UWO 241]|nr:hypothetical protein FOA52_009921 [Chlamydomonas sp. UWO 241]
MSDGEGRAERGVGQNPAAGSLGPPRLESDVNTLIDCFYLEVQGGRPCDLQTFKCVWAQLHFGFVHQGVVGG